MAGVDHAIDARSPVDGASAGEFDPPGRILPVLMNPVRILDNFDFAANALADSYRRVRSLSIAFRMIQSRSPRSSRLMPGRLKRRDFATSSSSCWAARGAPPSRRPARPACPRSRTPGT